MPDKRQDHIATDNMDARNSNRLKGIADAFLVHDREIVARYDDSVVHGVTERVIERVIGFAFDGTGYGDDGAVWGAETMVADLTGNWRHPLSLLVDWRFKETGSRFTVSPNSKSNVT